MVGLEHQYLHQYVKMPQSGLGRRTKVYIRKCKIIALVLGFLLLFIILNLQTIIYVIQEFFLGENFNIKLCYHFNDNDDSKRSEAMPKIIHQIDLGNGMYETDELKLYSHCQKSWKEMNEDYEYILWTTSMIQELIHECYPSLRPLFERYQRNPKIMKNIASYIVVHKMGGAYVDIDIMCKQNLNELHRETGEKTVTLNYQEGTYGISNKFFMANKGHEFMTHVLDGLENAGVFYFAPFVKTTFSTGSVFLFGRYLNYPHKDEVYILPSRSQYVERVVFRQSWYSIDGQFITIVWKGIDPIQLICVILMIVFILRLTTLLKVRRDIYIDYRLKGIKHF